MMQMVIPVIQPRTLIVYCGDYQTNCVLKW